jgi:hypothetical protein
MLFMFGILDAEASNTSAGHLSKPFLSPIFYYFPLGLHLVGFCLFMHSEIGISSCTSLRQFLAIVCLRLSGLAGPDAAVHIDPASFPVLTYEGIRDRYIRRFTSASLHSQPSPTT